MIPDSVSSAFLLNFSNRSPVCECDNTVNNIYDNCLPASTPTGDHNRTRLHSFQSSSINSLLLLCLSGSHCMSHPIKPVLHDYSYDVTLQIVWRGCPDARGIFGQAIVYTFPPASTVTVVYLQYFEFKSRDSIIFFQSKDYQINPPGRNFLTVF